MFIDILLFIALAAVTLTLLAGVITMSRNKGKQDKRSNKLMRLRVVLQAVAIVILMIGFYLKSNAGG